MHNHDACEDPQNCQKLKLIGEAIRKGAGAAHALQPRHVKRISSVAGTTKGVEFVIERHPHVFEPTGDWLPAVMCRKLETSYLLGHDGKITLLKENDRGFEYDIFMMVMIAIDQAMECGEIVELFDASEKEIDAAVENACEYLRDNITTRIEGQYETKLVEEIVEEFRESYRDDLIERIKEEKQALIDEEE